MKRVALVFDDGPSPEQVLKLLAVLAAENVRVSLSYIGKNVDAHPELARAAAAAGHEINNHSYTHPHMPQLDEAGVLEELGRTNQAVESATGKTPCWFWPPYLETGERLRMLADAPPGPRHFPLERHRILSTRDWDVKGVPAPAIIEAATTDVSDGCILVMHEWRAETVQSMPVIITSLRQQGFSFVTLSELDAGRD